MTRALDILTVTAAFALILAAAFWLRFDMPIWAAL